MVGLYLEEWPYPIKIYTLGRFEIIRDDEPLHFSGKEQKKPLELLKALIAFGGRDVPEERLTDALWPDADGDHGAQVLRDDPGPTAPAARRRGLYQIQGTATDHKPALLLGGQPCAGASS